MKQTVADPIRSIAARVHPTAIIDASSELGADVGIGPYCVIGPNVTIGSGTQLGPHVVVERDTTIGDGCHLHAGAVVGGDPQDLKYAGEPTRLMIGSRTVIRECATLNRGTGDGGVTSVGSDCLLMAYSHVAHDCVIGDRVVIANAVEMAGHVRIDEWAVVGGLTAIHQFVRIGQHAIVGGASALRKDVPPYVKAAGNPASLYGLNSVGLQRRGFAYEVRRELRQVYRLVFQSELNVSQALAAARAQVEPSPEVALFLDFIEESERGITVQR
ncbi:MAG: acyl-ACP--UDP-N-acetylglucosamine O-acyltransferase [Longimicrobiales bacterium]